MFSTSDENTEPNEIIKYMSGNWDAQDIMIDQQGNVSTDEYKEQIRIKDHETTEITANGIQGGKVITRDMKISMVGGLTLSQGYVTLKGEKKENSLVFRGSDQGNTYEIRLCMFPKSFSFQRDVWNNGKVVEVQMSHVRRKE